MLTTGSGGSHRVCRATPNLVGRATGEVVDSERAAGRLALGIGCWSCWGTVALYVQ